MLTHFDVMSANQKMIKSIPLLLTVFLLLSVFTLTQQRPTSNQIAGGRQAQLGEFPFAVGIRSPGINSIWCGGGLISTRHVLTAAHCMTLGDAEHDYLKPDEVEVMLGRVDLQNDKQGFFVGVEQIFIHANYDNATFDYDIALIKLKRNVPLSDSVQIVSLYEGEVDLGMMLTAVGWGFTDAETEANNIKPTVMRTVDVPIVNCTDEDPNPTKQFCAGQGHGKDTCAGDSGGVVVMKREDGSFQGVGIVSNGGDPCGGPGVYGVYTEIPDFIDWIQARTSSAATQQISLLIMMACLVLSFVI